MFGFKMTDYDLKVYKEELEPFLPKNIVDAHSHVYLRSDNKEIRYWPERVAVDNSIEDLVQTYKDMFPNNTVVPVVFGMSGEEKYNDNAYVAQSCKKYNYPTLFFTDYYMSSEELEKRVVEGGFKGLKPYFYQCRKGVSQRDAGIYDFMPEHHLKVADKLGLTLVLHISKEDRIKNKDNVKTLMEIEQKYPNIKLIVAHVGRAYAKEDFGDSFETLKHSEKMFFDFSANTLPYATEKCIESVGTKRVLFGSDLPISKMRMYRVVENGVYINVIPKGLYGDVSGDPHMREVEDASNMTNFMYEIIRGFKKTAEKLTLTKKDIEDIMCNNAASLYNIKF